MREREEAALFGEDFTSEIWQGFLRKTRFKHQNIPVCILHCLLLYFYLPRAFWEFCIWPYKSSKQTNSHAASGQAEEEWLSDSIIVCWNIVHSHKRTTCFLSSVSIHTYFFYSTQIKESFNFSLSAPAHTFLLLIFKLWMILMYIFVLPLRPTQSFPDPETYKSPDRELKQRWQRQGNVRTSVTETPTGCRMGWFGTTQVLTDNFNFAFPFVFPLFIPLCLACIWRLPITVSKENAVVI